MQLYVLQTPYAHAVIGADRILITAQRYNVSKQQQLHRLIADLRATGPVHLTDVMASTPELMNLLRRSEDDPVGPDELALLSAHRAGTQAYPATFNNRQRL